MAETVNYRDPPDVKAPGAPLLLWIVGIVSLLWNSYGCYDYTMTKLDPAHYLAGSGMSAAGQAYLDELAPALDRIARASLAATAPARVARCSISF